MRGNEIRPADTEHGVPEEAVVDELKKYDNTKILDKVECEVLVLDGTAEMTFGAAKELYDALVNAKNSQKLCHILAEQLGWNENHSYRVPGTVFEDQQIARFDLSRANMIQQTNSVPKDPMPQSNTKQSEINNA